MNMLKKQSKGFWILVCLQGVVAFLGFLKSFIFAKNLIITSESVPNDLTSLIYFTRFLVQSSSQNTVTFFLHNFGISLLSNLLSLLSLGFLGIPQLFSAFSVLGISATNGFSISLLVAALETLGVCISVGFSTIFSWELKNREVKKSNVLLKNALLILFLAFLYLITALIESNYIRQVG